ncbi:hypothetical protein TraAM80_06305 [Trypanosoma rangeli]|uniref:MSP domain-containing protein n=1 Tax=Trypanosoma rangeli TaxID=5698 RepID=A0A3R7LSM6_TRYRA|nr:uncharacterized protein TraAM80_06305 [Trypanosoma rangeli]RNF02572.1 hypothetical protein TraAM80_06305 [Trypanosoma rangeli]|eukprot:RNF02572.1 hypothetical protein TraAM80_06305 [Trypanosoma rangeli]
MELLSTVDKLERKRKNDAALSASETLVLLEPSSLLFPPPHRGRAVQNVVVMYNIGSLPCIFKIKSRTPERYYIKPNMGTISAQGAVRVCCILRPQAEDLPSTTRDVFRFCLKPIPWRLLPKRRELLHGAKLKKLWDAADCEALTTVTKQLHCCFEGDAASPPGAFITVLDPATIGLEIPAERTNAVSASATGVDSNDSTGLTQEASQQEGRPSSIVKRQGKGLQDSTGSTPGPSSPSWKEQRESMGGAGSSISQGRARELTHGMGFIIRKTTKTMGHQVLLVSFFLMVCNCVWLVFHLLR